MGSRHMRSNCLLTCSCNQLCVNSPCCWVLLVPEPLPLVWIDPHCCQMTACCDLCPPVGGVCLKLTRKPEETYVSQSNLLRTKVYESCQWLINRADWFCVVYHIPSTDWEKGSEGLSGGATASSSSSCSVPICIPEYWLSLPSNTYTSHKNITIRTKNQASGSKHKLSQRLIHANAHEENKQVHHASLWENHSFLLWFLLNYLHVRTNFGLA